MKRLFAITLVVSLLFSSVSLAAGKAVNGCKDDGTQRYSYLDHDNKIVKKQWISLSNGGWCYADDYGYLMSSEWFQDADGKWYYFDEWGDMLSATTTPDGYYVGADGAWVQQ